MKRLRFESYLREIARQPEGPPSPSAMDFLVHQLIWDGEIDRAYEVSDDMVKHAIARDDAGAQGAFMQWLGIRGTIQTFRGVRDVARNDRERKRAARRHAAGAVG